MNEADLLFKQHYPGLYRLAMSFLRNREDVADMMQDVYLAMKKQQTRSSILEMANPKAWLYRVATNLCLNHVKRRKRTGDLLRDNIRQMIPLKGNSIHQRTAEENLIAEDELSRISVLIRSLSPKNRMLLELFHRGLKYDEIAAALNMKKESVGNKLYRVRTRLAASLKSEGGIQ